MVIEEIGSMKATLEPRGCPSSLLLLVNRLDGRQAEGIRSEITTSLTVLPPELWAYLRTKLYVHMALI